jgi:hypothetical protein
MKKSYRLILIVILLAGICAINLAAGELEIYHGNTRSYVFHRSSCRYFDCQNCTKIFKTREEALAAGYRPCRVCNP